MANLLNMIWQFIRALFGWVPGVPAPKRPDDLPEEVPASGEPKWLQLARQDLGIKEVPGKAANPEIMRAWRYCDYDPPDGDETAWCSAKACEWIERAGLPSTRAPNARSWEKWGATLKSPKPGAVTVFWRGTPNGWQGHVALYLGKGSKPGTIKVLGGNQSNGVTIQDYSEAQLIGYRWPTNGGNSRTLRAQTAGLVGDGLTGAGVVGAAIDPTGIIQSLPDALAIGTALQGLATYWPWFTVVGITISILARLATIYARVNDWNLKGV
jgi:uncharacterized protein (TIGR02594 family)